MKTSDMRGRMRTFLLLSSMVVWLLTPPRTCGADYGRVSGTVADPQGNPLMGATVLVMGPLLAGPHDPTAAVERVITDARGKFTVEHLVPGWYTLKVTSPTRLPALRNGVRVEAGQTARAQFLLTDIFAPLRLQAPLPNVSTWGEDWKWVLRTSAITRPVLRYQEVARTAARAKALKPPLPVSQRLIGMVPGSARREALRGDPGLGSVLAYFRPLSEGTDVLVAGSMAANGVQASSLATALRRNMLKGDPQELTLALHQLSFSEALPLTSGVGRQSVRNAQALVLSYAHTRRLSDSVSLTAGFGVDYLNAARGTLAARPLVKLEYRVNPSDVLTVRYGTVRADGNSTLLERVGVLNAFPRVTLRGYRPQLENTNHAEVSFNRRFTKTSALEIAAYQDYFQNAAVWGFGGPELLNWLAGDALPNPAANGLTLNAGNYRSSGLRAAYSRSLGSHVEAAFVYSTGQALDAKGFGLSSEGARRRLQGVLQANRSQSCAGRVSARIPATKTQITTSYVWLQRGRVTGVDPYGQASFQLQPFLGIQIRQPLPTLAFLPARIEALADFRNLLAQGYVPLARGGEEPFLLTPAYRSLRGGFSVQF